MAKQEEVEYPDITVELSDCDGNIYAVVGRVRNALRDAGERDRAQGLMQEIEDNCEDYDEALKFLMRLVVVE